MTALRTYGGKSASILRFLACRLLLFFNFWKPKHASMAFRPAFWSRKSKRKGLFGPFLCSFVAFCCFLRSAGTYTLFFELSVCKLPSFWVVSVCLACVRLLFCDFSSLLIFLLFFVRTMGKYGYFVLLGWFWADFLPLWRNFCERQVIFACFSWLFWLIWRVFVPLFVKNAKVLRNIYEYQYCIYMQLHGIKTQYICILPARVKMVTITVDCFLFCASYDRTGTLAPSDGRRIDA